MCYNRHICEEEHWILASSNVLHICNVTVQQKECDGLQHLSGILWHFNLQTGRTTYLHLLQICMQMLERTKHQCFSPAQSFPDILGFMHFFPLHRSQSILLLKSLTENIGGRWSAWTHRHVNTKPRELMKELIPLKIKGIRSPRNAS